MKNLYSTYKDAFFNAPVVRRLEFIYAFKLDAVH